jgi:hypothetical protein
MAAAVRISKPDRRLPVESEEFVPSLDIWPCGSSNPDLPSRLNEAEGFRNRQRRTDVYRDDGFPCPCSHEC